MKWCSKMSVPDADAQDLKNTKKVGRLWNHLEDGRTTSRSEVVQGTERLKTSQSWFPELLACNRRRETGIQESCIYTDSCASHREKCETTYSRGRPFMHCRRTSSGQSVHSSGTVAHHTKHGGHRTKTHGTRMWRTSTGFREMPKEGSLEELGMEFGADRGRRIASPGAMVSRSCWTRQDTTCFDGEWACAVHTSQKTRRTLCHQTLRKGAGEPHVRRRDESGESDRVVVHNRHIEFPDGTKSKRTEQTRWMDRHRLSSMS